MIENTDALNNKSLRELLRALDSHAPGEADHAERVAIYAVATGERLGLGDDLLRQLRFAGALHDIGKLNVDRLLLARPLGLTSEESTEIRRHSLYAQVIIENSMKESSGRAELISMIRGHHERFDGSGYPDGLIGESIPLAARILSICECFDTMSYGNHWRTRMGTEEAKGTLIATSANSFDPRVLVAFWEAQSVIQPMGL